MKQSIMMLSGMTYDYCSEVVLNRIIGFLDEEQNIFTGIEINDKECNIRDLEDIKRYLIQDNATLRYLCGNLDGNFEYYAADLQKGKLQYCRMVRRNAEEMVGNIKVLQDGKKTTIVDSLYSSISSKTYVQDEELKAIITDLLEKEKNNHIIKGFRYSVEIKAKESKPVNKVLFKAVPSQR